MGQSCSKIVIFLNFFKERHNLKLTCRQNMVIIFQFFVDLLGFVPIVIFKQKIRMPKKQVWEGQKCSLLDSFRLYCMQRQCRLDAKVPVLNRGLCSVLFSVKFIFISSIIRTCLSKQCSLLVLRVLGKLAFSLCLNYRLWVVYLT